jgi:hypothetical protein
MLVQELDQMIQNLSFSAEYYDQQVMDYLFKLKFLSDYRKLLKFKAKLFATNDFEKQKQLLELITKLIITMKNYDSNQK